MNRKEIILNFIEDELLDDDEEISFETSLFKEMILDSLNLLGLISFLEKKFNIKIATSEVNYENLDSIENIDNFLNRKCGK